LSAVWTDPDFNPDTTPDKRLTMKVKWLHERGYPRSGAPKHLRLTVVAWWIVAGSVLSCSDGPDYQHSAVVTASAYNSLPEQAQGDPAVTAWGDELKPGMKAIAVSRDLIERGLDHGTKVKIEGLDGTYEVLDKTNVRFTERIDIYMGEDVDAAREWGAKEVTIRWN
jgi:3D (Asp-Asp-Asp) domain-containing protein